MLCVTVGGITTCEGTDPTLMFGTLDGTAIGTPVPFTPPSGTITVPNVADGAYRIALSCGAGEDSVPFTVVNAQPNFTG